MIEKDNNKIKLREKEEELILILERKKDINNKISLLEDKENLIGKKMKEIDEKKNL